MPWFAPQPSEAEIAFWGLRSSDNLVSRWPHKQTDRSNCRFRLPHSQRFDSTAIRWSVIVDLFDDDPPFDVSFTFGWLDLAVVTEGKLSGSTGIDPLTGFNFLLSFESFAVLPGSGTPGVLATLRLEVDGEWSQTTYEYVQSVNPFVYNQWQLTLGSGGSSSQSAGWSLGIWGLEFTALADCYPFPSPEGEDVAGLILTNQLIAADDDQFADIVIPGNVDTVRILGRVRGGTVSFNGIGIQFGRGGVVDSGANDYRYKWNNYGNSQLGGNWANNSLIGIDRSNLVPIVNRPLDIWCTFSLDIVGAQDAFETSLLGYCGGFGQNNRWSVATGYHNFKEDIDLVRVSDYAAGNGWAEGSKLTAIGWS